MTSPLPSVALSGHCSVISSSTLFVYSPQAFQSLPLKRNGSWSKLQNGVPVAGASCVLQSAPGNSTGDVLWVVGGVPTSGDSEYPGLQRYTFSSQTWETVTPVVKVTENRQSHASVFLPGLSSILVYAGSQTSNTIPTTDTFLISTESPYSVQSYSAKNSPAVLPLLLLWDNSSAITLGGASDNTNIYRFQFGLGWQAITPSLTQPLKSSNLQQATLIQGSDNSRVLQLYDLSVSPNNISEVVLQNAAGKPARPGKFIPRGTKRKRDITLATWPPYNNTFAPTSTRSGYGLARSDDGVVAISGGGEETRPVALFNEQTNGWINTTSFFGDSTPQTPIVNTATPSSIPATSPTASSSPPPPSIDGNHARTSLILGATLGCILGFVALLVIALLILRWRRRKEAQRKALEEQEEDDDEEKDRMSFEDRGDPFMKEEGAPVYPQSHHSLSIYEGEVGHNVRTHRRSETLGSQNSTTHLVSKKSDTFEMSLIRERSPDLPSQTNEALRSSASLQVPGGLEGPKRSSGWSRYFSGNDIPAIQGIKSARSSAASNNSGGASAAMLSVRKSGPSSSHSSLKEPSLEARQQSLMELPPLDMGQQFQERQITKAVTGNLGASAANITRQSDERPRTISSSFSTIPPSTAVSLWSQDGNEEHSTWTPVTRSDAWNTPRSRDTGTSSFYGGSVDGFDSGTGGPGIAKPGALPTRPSVGLGSGRLMSGAHVLPRSVQEEEEQVRPVNNTPTVRLVETRAKQPETAAVVQSDLSWLNLGATK